MRSPRYGDSRARRRIRQLRSAVADTILRTTTCPVLVIPWTADDDASPEPYQEILCGVSSGLSTVTLRYALSFAQESESQLTTR